MHQYMPLSACGTRSYPYWGIVGSGCCVGRGCLVHNAHYGFIVTFRGANFWHRVLMRHCGIGSTSFRLEPRKVAMNHIMERDIDNTNVCGTACSRLFSYAA